MCVCPCSRSQPSVALPAAAGVGLLAWGAVHVEWWLAPLTEVLAVVAVAMAAATAAAAALLVWAVRSDRRAPAVEVAPAAPLALPPAPLALPPAAAAVEPVLSGRGAQLAGRARG